MGASLSRAGKEDVSSWEAEGEMLNTLAALHPCSRRLLARMR